MAGLSITGQMKVSTLQEGFLKEFGLILRVYDGREFADPSQTLAQVRKKKGSGKALSVAKNMKVGNLEDKFEVEFGLKVQVAGSDDSYLCKDELTLNAAQQEDEKKLARKERKAARQAEASDDGDESEASPLPSPQDSGTATAALMPLSQVINALKEQYSDHTDYDEMMTDLNSNEYLDHWANKLCGEEFNQNTEIARSLYALHLEQSETCSDILRLAENIISEEYLNDKSWAKELYEKAVGLAGDSSDFLWVADSVVAADKLNDKILAKTLYGTAIEKSGVANEYKDIAISIAKKEKLDDSEWARDIFEKAIECATDIYDYREIAEAIADKDGLNDKDWSKEIFQKAIDASEGVTDHQSIANSIADECYLNDKVLGAEIMKKGIDSFGIRDNYEATSIAYDLVVNLDDRPWAKTIYQEAIDLCEDDEQRKDVIEAIKNEFEDAKWARDLANKFSIQLDDDDEKDDLDEILDEMVEEDGKDEITKYVFMASINLYESVFESEHGDFDFEKEKCPEIIRKIIIDEVSEFCECVSMRLDEGDPCFLVINKSSNTKDYIRINPGPIEPGVNTRVSDSIRNANVERLAEFTGKDILWSFDENVMVAMLVNGCDHWDRNFLKVSQAYPEKSFSLIGWHEYSNDFAVQGIDDGDFDTGIESEGGDDYLGEKVFKRFGLTEQDFDIKKYK